VTGEEGDRQYPSVCVEKRNDSKHTVVRIHTKHIPCTKRVRKTHLIDHERERERGRENERKEGKKSGRNIQ